jgi:hypothetical protein
VSHLLLLLIRLVVVKQQQDLHLLLVGVHLRWV